jgi:hypothetical protein
MFPYWLLFAIFALGALWMRSQPAHAMAGVPTQWRPKGDQLILFAALVPIAMIGFRFEVGSDWYNYMRMFNDVRSSNLWTETGRVEPGYVALSSIAVSLGLRIWAVNLVCAILFTGGLIRFARCQPNPWLAVVVAIPYLIIGVAMGYSRQGVAIGLVMFGLAAIERRSFLKFAAWVIAAALFHRTAIIILPIVASSYIRNRWHAFAVAAFAAVVGYFAVIASAMDYYEAGYVNYAYDAQGAAVRLSMNAIPAAIFLLFPNRFNVVAEQKRTWRTMAIAAWLCVIALFLVSSSVIVDRLALYIIPLQIFVLSRLPHVFGYRGHPSGGITTLVIAYSAVVQFVFLNYAENARWWLPYQTFLSADCSFGGC